MTETENDDLDRRRFDTSLELAMTQLPLTPEPDTGVRHSGLRSADHDDDREVES